MFTAARPAVVVHAGSSTGWSRVDGIQAAADRALTAVADDALAASVAAVHVLEADGRYNAGAGADLALDGATVEVDAAVMSSDGMLGAVAAVAGLRHPVLLARAVCDTPHHLLCGEGALALAQRLGFATPIHISAALRDKQAHTLRTLLAEPDGEMLPGVRNSVFVQQWNYRRTAAEAQVDAAARVAKPGEPAPDASWREELGACDTVGAVARDARGRFAVAVSTGGTTPALWGRVGDSPLIGCGFYAGPLGAIAATGVGEHILRTLLARTAYGWLEQGVALPEALQRAVALLGGVEVGLIGITADEAAAASCRDMAYVVTPLAERAT